MDLPAFVSRTIRSRPEGECLRSNAFLPWRERERVIHTRVDLFPIVNTRSRKISRNNFSPFFLFFLFLFLSRIKKYG